MQPENNQNFPPPDYLDQIAPQEIKTPVLFIKKPVFIVILFSLFTIVMVVSLLASLPSKTESSQHLAARLKATEELTEDANNKIKSNKLRAINSNLKTNLLNMINDITKPISEQGINIKPVIHKNPEVFTDFTEKDIRLIAETLAKKQGEGKILNPVGMLLSDPRAVAEAILTGKFYPSKKTTTTLRQCFFIAMKTEIHRICHLRDDRGKNEKIERKYFK